MLKFFRPLYVEADNGCRGGSTPSSHHYCPAMKTLSPRQVSLTLLATYIVIIPHDHSYISLRMKRILTLVFRLLTTSKLLAYVNLLQITPVINSTRSSQNFN